MITSTTKIFLQNCFLKYLLKIIHCVKYDKFCENCEKSLKFKFKFYEAYFMWLNPFLITKNNIPHKFLSIIVFLNTRTTRYIVYVNKLGI